MSTAQPSTRDLAEPATPFLTRDVAFDEVTGEHPQLVRVVACDAHEGPVYAADEDALYFTSLPVRAAGTAAPPRVAIRRLALDGDRFPIEQERITTIVDDANAANGMALDHDGSLIVCEQGSPRAPACISRISRDGTRREVLVDCFGRAPLSSPNDVLVASDGSIWFTDPSYGHLQGFRPPPALRDAVYRYDRGEGSLAAVASDVDKPNGLAFSPDERTLYVTDSGANQEPASFYPQRPHEIRAFALPVGGGVESRLLAVTEPGFPDGIKVDDAGRVYASSFDGIQVFAAHGRLLGEITLPGAVNFTFAGASRDVLLITTDTAVWAAHIKATGPGLPAAPRAAGG